MKSVIKSIKNKIEKVNKNKIKLNMKFIIFIYTLIFLLFITITGFYIYKNIHKKSQKLELQKIDLIISKISVNLEKAIFLLEQNINNASDKTTITGETKVTSKDNNKISIIEYNGDLILKIKKVVGNKLFTIDKNINYIFNEIETNFNDYQMVISNNNDIIFSNLENYEEIDFDNFKNHSSIELFSNNYLLFKTTDNNFSFYILIPNKSFLDNVLSINSLIYIIMLFIIIMITIILIFKKRVYNPIISIENAFNAIADGRTDVELYVKENNELYGLSNRINEVINRLKDLINREYSSKLLKKQAELDALQSQINPHFLYNTLESIRGLALIEGSIKIANMTEALSNLFRYSISKKNNLVTLKEEINNIDNYLTIQQYRFKNKFKIIYEIDEDTVDFRIPKLGIQPIVENSVHHGLERKKGEGTIIIRASRTEKRLIINIEDNGLGIDKQKLEILNNRLKNGVDNLISGEYEKRENIGLINVNERIRLYFGEEFGIKVYSNYNIGTNVEIVLPLVNYDM